MNLCLHWFAVLLSLAACVVNAQGARVPDEAGEMPAGSTVESLLAIARQNNPEFSAMRHEAQAATERVVLAGALMDPRLKVELQDITRMGEQGRPCCPPKLVQLPTP